MDPTQSTQTTSDQQSNDIVDFDKLRAEHPEAARSLDDISSELGVDISGKVDMTKYKAKFKNITKEQLMQLVTTSTLLTDKDVEFIKYLIEDLKADQARIDMTFNIGLIEELEFLQKEIAELSASGESEELSTLKERLVVLNAIQTKLTPI